MGILARPQRDVRAFEAKFKALEKIADALTEPVVAEASLFDVVDEPAPKAGGSIPHATAGQSGRILIRIQARVEQLHQFADHQLGRFGVNTTTLTPGWQKRQDAPRHPSRMRKIKRHMKVRAVRRLLLFRTHRCMLHSP